jgi:hypothetical protein
VVGLPLEWKMAQGNHPRRKLTLRRITVNLWIIPLDPFLLFGSPPARIEIKLTMFLSEMHHRVRIVLEREAKM